MVLDTELNKIITEIIEKANQNLYAYLIGFDIVQYTYFLTNMYIDKKNEIIFEFTDINDYTGFMNLEELDTESKLRLQAHIFYLMRKIKQLKNEIN